MVKEEEKEEKEEKERERVPWQKDPEKEKKKDPWQKDQQKKPGKRILGKRINRRRGEKDPWQKDQQKASKMGLKTMAGLGVLNNKHRPAGSGTVSHKRREKYRLRQRNREVQNALGDQNPFPGKKRPERRKKKMKEKRRRKRRRKKGKKRSMRHSLKKGRSKKRERKRKQPLPKGHRLKRKGKRKRKKPLPKGTQAEEKRKKEEEEALAKRTQAEEKKKREEEEALALLKAEEEKNKNFPALEEADSKKPKKQAGQQDLAVPKGSKKKRKRRQPLPQRVNKLTLEPSEREKQRQKMAEKEEGWVDVVRKGKKRGLTQPQQQPRLGKSLLQLLLPQSLSKGPTTSLSKGA